MSESYTKQARIGLFARLPWRERIDRLEPGVSNRAGLVACCADPRALSGTAGMLDPVDDPQGWEHDPLLEIGLGENDATWRDRANIRALPGTIRSTSGHARPPRFSLVARASLQAKKSPLRERAESIFLEENRGDRCSMLHCRK
ncbi:hypothetical protein [Massilia scottii]|uniref:hypothetical protein n=1 Tax=Massilia scottii TaxID=3057166 RepID=UPI00279643B5|nr:hypothetical protein [Massilia sp. CCM 9029]MDQ1833036.1 hypothetical protein [Massilia sp. CCM 9029]